MNIIVNPKQKFLIYVLIDKRYPEKIRYVGKTTTTAKKRLNSHIHTSKLDFTHKSNWIRSIGVENLEQFVIHEANTHEELSDLEIYYIQYFKNLGHDLTNLTNGGDGVPNLKHSDNTKEKISINRKKYWSNPEHKKKMSEQKKVAYSNPEYKKIQSKNCKTKKPVQQIDKNTHQIIAIFESSVAASKNTGIHQTAISNCCNNTKKSAGGFLWKFL